jgi:hypothetical protein
VLLACALGSLLAASPAGAAAPDVATRGGNSGPELGEPADNSEPEDPDYSEPADVPDPAAVLADKEARAREAAAAFAARRYPEAARKYEALFDEFDEPNFLLAAGRSRLAAGHRAHAVAYLSRLLASGRLTATDTQVAYGELAAAQKAVTPVTLRIELPADLDHVPQLSAEHIAPQEIDPRPPLEFPLPTGSSPTRVLLLQLDPGTWQLQVDDPALESVELVVDVLGQPGEVLHLDLRPHDHDLPRLQRRRLVGVLAGLGGATLGAGIGVMLVGDRAVQRTLTRKDCLEQDDCADTLADVTTLRSAGAGILGAGAGVAIVGLTGLAREPRLRRGLWFAELGIGGAGLLGSVVAVALAARRFNHDATPSGDPAGDPDALAGIERRTVQHTAASAGIGLGSGLVFAAAIALLRTQKNPQRHLAPALGMSPGGLGPGLALAVSGRF